MNENQKTDKNVFTNANQQLPPIFMSSTRSNMNNTNNRGTRDNTRDIDIPAVPYPPESPDYPVIPLPPIVPDSPDYPVIPLPPIVPDSPDYPVVPLPPFVPAPPDYPVAPLPPFAPDYPVIPLPPFVPDYPRPSPPGGMDRISVNAKLLLEYMGLYLDGLRAAYPLSINRPREYREEIRAIRNRAYILYDDATAIVGRMPVTLQQNNNCVGCKATTDALRQSLRNGKLALQRIVNLIYLNGNRSIDAQLLSLFIRLNEDLKNIQDLL